MNLILVIYLVLLFNNVDLLLNKSYLSFFKEKHLDECLVNTDNCTKSKNIIENDICFSIYRKYDSVVYDSIEHLNIQQWLPIQAIPNCWKLLKELICSMKHPPCIKKGNKWKYFKKIGKELCLNTLSECSLLVGNSFGKTLVKETPYFLKCNQYPSNCFSNNYPIPKKIPDKNRLNKHQETKRNENCKYPLVDTDISSLWLPGISGCTFHCMPPNLSKYDYQSSRILLGSLGCIFVIFNFFFIVTYILARRNYQAWNLKMPPILGVFCAIHCHLLLGALGWSAQLIPSVYKSILCDGNAPRIRQPQTQIGDSLSCVAVFSLIYFSLIASALTSLSLIYMLHSALFHLYTNLSTTTHTNPTTPSPQHSTTDNQNNNNNSGKAKFAFSIWKKNRKKKKLLSDTDLNNSIKLINLRTNENQQPIDANNEQLITLRQLFGDREHTRCQGQLTTSQIFLILISTVLLVVSLTSVEVSADPKSGICFIGNGHNVDIVVMLSKLALTLLPLVFILLAKTYFIIKIIRHFRVLKHNPKMVLLMSPFLGVSSYNSSFFQKKFSTTSRYLALMLMFLWFLCIFSIYTHVHLFLNEPVWREDLRQQFICRLRHKLLYSSVIEEDIRDSTTSFHCPILTRPSINILLLHNCSYFGLNLSFLCFSLSGFSWFRLWKQAFIHFLTFIQNSKTKIDSKKSDQFLTELLLDGVWNPGLFLYLSYIPEKKITKHEEVQKNMTLNSKPIKAGQIKTHDSLSMTSSSNMSFCKHNECRSSNDYGAHLLNLFFNNPEYCSSIPAGVHKSNSFAGRPGPPHPPTKSPASGTNFSIQPPKSSHNLCTPLVSHPHTTHTHHRHHLGCNSRRLSATDLIPPHSKQARRHSLRSAADIISGGVVNGALHTCSGSHPPHQVLAAAPSNHARYHTPQQYTATSRIQAPPTNGPQRYSASCGCVSSAGGESYNSYRLMVEQQGGRWRDLCRTRMTIQDALNWATTAVSHQFTADLCDPLSCNQCRSALNLLPNQNCSCCCSLVDTTTTTTNQNHQISSSINNQITNQGQSHQQIVTANQIEAQSESSIHDDDVNKMLLDVEQEDNSSDTFDSEDEVVSMNLSDVEQVD